MAIQPEELFGSQSFDGVDGMFIEDTITAQFTTGSGTILKGHPVAHNTAADDWEVWANGGANSTGTIKGFAAEDIVLHATNKVMGKIMSKGEINVSDMILPISTTGLAAALHSGNPGLRELNIRVTGLEQIK